MFQSPEIDKLSSTLKRFATSVETIHTNQSTIANRILNITLDFPSQPTVWDAVEGRNVSQKWELPSEFPALYANWISAHATLVNQDPRDEDALWPAIKNVYTATLDLLTSLYNKKAQRP